MIKFSNPRLQARIENYPLGGSKRGLCVFSVEYRRVKGYRFSRVTTGKPKTTTYGGKGAIVDGSDGRTYCIQHTACGSFINVWRSDFMTYTFEEHNICGVFKHRNPELYNELQDLIEEVNKKVINLSVNVF